MSGARLAGDLPPPMRKGERFTDYLVRVTAIRSRTANRGADSRHRGTRRMSGSVIVEAALRLAGIAHAMDRPEWLDTAAAMLANRPEADPEGGRLRRPSRIGLSSSRRTAPWPWSAGGGIGSTYPAWRAVGLCSHGPACQLAQRARTESRTAASFFQHVKQVTRLAIVGRNGRPHRPHGRGSRLLSHFAARSAFSARN